MKRQLRQTVLVALLVILIFAALNYFLLYSIVSTGPNLDLSVGWLELHRHGENWTIERFHFGFLIVVVLSSILLAWFASRVISRRLT
jgi:hypothetical protein